MIKLQGLIVVIAALIIYSIVSYASGTIRKQSHDETEPKNDIETAQEVNEVKEKEDPPPSASAPSDSENEFGITKEDKEKTREIAKQFAKAFYNYDANNQLSYLENSKPYMTSDFYEREKENPRRNPLDKTITEAKEIDMYPVDGDSNYEIMWNAYITGETISSDDEEGIEEASLWIILIEEDSEWKVKGGSFE